MTPTLKLFLQRLSILGVSPRYDFVGSEWNGRFQTAPSIVIPAECERVGSLSIYDEDDELTVEIGQLHHVHFSAYNYDGQAIEQRLAAAADDAARFVAELLADLVYISVDYCGGRGIGSSHGYVACDGASTSWVRLPDASLTHDEATRSVRFLWSGPIDNP